MTDKELFQKALAAAGGRKGVLAEKCAVSRQTISYWRKGDLTDRARAMLQHVVDSAIT